MHGPGRQPGMASGKDTVAFDNPLCATTHPSPPPRSLPCSRTILSLPRKPAPREVESLHALDEFCVSNNFPALRYAVQSCLLDGGESLAQRRNQVRLCLHVAAAACARPAPRCGQHLSTLNFGASFGSRSTVGEADARPPNASLSPGAGESPREMLSSADAKSLSKGTLGGKSALSLEVRVLDKFDQPVSARPTHQPRLCAPPSARCPPTPAPRLACLQPLRPSSASARRGKQTGMIIRVASFPACAS